MDKEASYILLFREQSQGDSLFAPASELGRSRSSTILGPPLRPPSWQSAARQWLSSLWLRL